MEARPQGLILSLILLMRWMIFCGIILSPLYAYAGQSLTTGLSDQRLHEVISESRWSIIRSKMHAYRFVDDYGPVHKRYSERSAPVRLSHREIRELQDYRKVKFLAPVNYLQSHFIVSPLWNLSEFIAKANFSSAHFDAPVDFEWVIFNDSVYFSYAQFNSFVSYYGSLFNDVADFYRTNFKGGVSFDSVTFQESASFAHASFAHTADFSEVHFSDPVDFSHANFINRGQFTGAVFAKQAEFMGASIAEELDLSRAEFGATVTMNGMILPKYLNLSHVVKMANGLDLTGVKKTATREKCMLNLLGADISRIKFRYGPFQLYFPKSSTHADRVAVYEAVLKMLNENGFKESYREVMIEYKRYQYHHEKSWITNWIQDYGWDYGFDPERIFYWIMITLLFFTSINALFYRKLVEKVMDVPFLSRHVKSEYIERHFILRYIFYFPFTLLYTLLILFSHLLGFRRDFTDFRSPSLLVNVYVVILILVGITCSLFILNYLIGE